MKNPLDFFGREPIKEKTNTREIKIFNKLLMVMLVFLFGFFCAQYIKAEDNKNFPNLKISEFMYDFDGSDKDNEWIEVYNDSNGDIILEQVRKYSDNYILPIRVCTKVKDGNCSESSPVYSKKKKAIIGEGELFVITNKNKSYKVSKKNKSELISFVSNFTLGNGEKEDLGIIWSEKSEKEKFLDKVAYSKKWGADGNARTLERIDYDKDGKRENWIESVYFLGTPGFEYSKQKNAYTKKIKISETLPDPIGKDRFGEYIEIVNNSEKRVNLWGWSLEDDSGKSFFFEEDEVIFPKEIMPLKRGKTGLILNNKGTERVKLINPVGGVVDDIEYQGSKQGFCYAYDKQEKWKWTRECSFGEENVFPEPKKCPENLKISEIFPNPEENEKENEWIEIHNPGKEKASLEGCYLADENLLEKDIDRYFKFSEKYCIKPGGYFSVKRERFNFGMNNGGEVVALAGASGETVDRIHYDSSEEGQAYAFNGKNWGWTEIPTPGKRNRFPEPKKYPGKIEITEFLANAEGRDKGKEWIEIYNKEKQKADLSGWKIENQSGREFEIENFSIKPGGLKVLKLKNTSFSIRNSGGWIALADPNGKLVSKAEYAGPAKAGSSYNQIPEKDGKEWGWSHFLTPGGKNKINHPPRFKIDKPREAYEDVKAYFELDSVKDPDGDKVKIRWDFGDGHRSYKKENSHVYEDEGEYEVEARVSDPSVHVFEKFEIEVDDYPEYDLEIVKLLPNPAGRDSEGEVIWIKNNSDEDLDLKDWSVATGKDKESLTNHPIREEFEIEAGEVDDLERDDSAFALLNKKGRVELRYPNGETADKVKYEKNRIEEEELYVLEEKKWIWQKSNFQEENEEKEKPPQKEVSVASVEEQHSSSGFSISEIIANEETKQSQALPRLVFKNWLNSNFPGKVWRKMQHYSNIATS
ncbi:MAG: lamin tail domain-containing protein [Candidatus Moranbacteria bacterium]|nr:lamin tail domain-containing protein [Candidatus Moranbacteria bacterium]